MTLISHEIPKQLFPNHDFINDYPYILLHLCDPYGKYFDREYTEFYKELLKDSSYSIMDNSAYELGDSYDVDKVFELGQIMGGTHIIIPDSLGNMQLTKQRCIDYIEKYGNKSIPKFIAVLQGKTLEEIKELYEFYNTIDSIDIIAVPYTMLPFDSWKEIYSKSLTTKFSEENYRYAFKMHRIDVLSWITAGDYKAVKKKFHLLGCLTPNEFNLYSKEQLSVIKSIDTSAPIVYGWEGVEFNKTILIKDLDKPKSKLAENLDIKLGKQQLKLITRNIKQFRDSIGL